MRQIISHILVLLSAATILYSADGSLAVKKPLVAVLGNTFFSEEHDINVELKAFAESLLGKGHRVTNVQLSRIDDAALEGIDVFVLPLPEFSLSEEDRGALKRFLRGGGGLLVLGYPGGKGIDEVNALISEFGVSFGAESWNDLDAMIPPGSTLSGPRKCERVGGFVPRIYLKLSAGKVEPAARDDAGVLAAVSTLDSLGDGRLVIIGSDQPFLNDHIGKLDNKAFCLNAIDYLSGANTCDLAAIVTKFKGKSNYTGGKLTVITRIKNIGKVASDETKVRFALVDSSSKDSASPPLKKLRTVKLQPLNPGKSKTRQIEKDKSQNDNTHKNRLG